MAIVHRQFAAVPNRPEVRLRLKLRGVHSCCSCRQSTSTKLHEDLMLFFVDPSWIDLLVVGWQNIPLPPPPFISSRGAET